MSAIRDLPEIAGLEGHAGMVRIPSEVDVPLTDRVRALVDTAEFRRLAHISQLGLVGLVYPAAIHTRFEHSLGVYRLALLFLRQLSHDRRFAALVSTADAELFIAAALLHDLGHWPFCHPIEDMRLPSVPQHELFANSFLLEGEIADALRHDWAIQPRDVVDLLSGKPRDARSRLLASMLSGPIDIDKIDYLARDSLHAGVPYGRNFDQGRLIASLCLDAGGDGAGHQRKRQDRRRDDGLRPLRDVQRSLLAPRRAGRDGHAAAGFLPAARAARSRRAVSHDRRAAWWPRWSRPAARARPASCSTACSARTAGCTSGWRSSACWKSRRFYARLARRPYPWLAACAGQFAQLASTTLGRIVAPHEILFDAPPVEREVDFNIEVHFSKTGQYRPLGEISPVVCALGTQFDDYVKRVRIFAHPRIVDDLRQVADLTALLNAAIDQTE